MPLFVCPESSIDAGRAGVLSVRVMANDTDWPERFTAGTTVKVTRTHSAYPATSGWSLTFYLTGIDVITPVTGTPNGTGFDFTLSATVTAKLRAGTYRWTERAVSGAEKYTAESGVLVVDADPAQMGATDGQSWEEKALALVEARLLGRYSEDMESFQIGTRVVTQIPHKELLAVRDDLKERLRVAGGGSFIREVRAAFTGTDSET